MSVVLTVWLLGCTLDVPAWVDECGCSASEVCRSDAGSTCEDAPEACAGDFGDRCDADLSDACRAALCGEDEPSLELECWHSDEELMRRVSCGAVAEP